MHVLYYWRRDNYQRDRQFGFGFHLNQGSRMLTKVETGESVWAFTRNRFDHYVIAAELVVRAVTRNPPKYRYGDYRIWGDLKASRYFDTETAPSAEQLIRSLNVTIRAKSLAQSFQGHRAVKLISEHDHRVLATFATDLKEIQKAAIYPEDEFEARLILGAEARDLLLNETDSRYAERTRYLYESVDITRARRHVEWLQETYRGQCQICLFDPRARYEHRLCHGHHIQWLSRGGEDKLRNMVLVCPNHHAAIHADDAAFDYGSLAFRFSNGLNEPLLVNSHLPQAA